jgi:uncharacterized protein (TIGR02145 family)
MKKLPCMLAMLFSIGLFTACSNSACENPSDMGETAQEGSSSSDNKLSVEVLPPCKTETEDNCEYGTLMDNRNRFVYRTVKIGNQWWMAENLDVGRVQTCCDGEDCYKAGWKYGPEWTSPCPYGWHVPSVQEFDTLIAAVGGDSIAGLVLGARRVFFGNTGAGLDAYGFNALYIGEEHMRGFLTSTIGEDENGWQVQYVLMLGDSASGYYHQDAYFNILNQRWSVRCIKGDRGGEKVGKTSVIPSCKVPTSYIKRCKSLNEDNCEYGTLTDERDGQVYKTVKIGDQWWMAENLKFRYMQKTKKLDSSSFCINDSLENCEKYGRLYLWSAAMDSANLYSENKRYCGIDVLCNQYSSVRGVCPEGWHLPYYDEWDIVDSVTFLKGFDDPFGLNVIPTVMWNDSAWLEKSGNGITAFWSSWPDQKVRDRRSIWTVYMTDTVSRLEPRRADKPAYVRCIKDWAWPIDQ